MPQLASYGSKLWDISFVRIICHWIKFLCKPFISYCTLVDWGRHLRLICKTAGVRFLAHSAILTWSFKRVKATSPAWRWSNSWQVSGCLATWSRCTPFHGTGFASSMALQKENHAWKLGRLVNKAKDIMHGKTSPAQVGKLWQNTRGFKISPRKTVALSYKKDAMVTSSCSHLGQALWQLHSSCLCCCVCNRTKPNQLQMASFPFTSSINIYFLI